MDGVALERTAASPASTSSTIRTLTPEIVATASAAIIAGLKDVPELTGLPPFTTPIRAFILADDERFRLALAEIANVRIELVAEDIGGYTIERDGTMLIFFAAAERHQPASAALGYVHELAHLAVREATQRRALPQWFNEGYASWIAGQALARQSSRRGRLQGQLDRLAVASALHTRGLIPWADLVTRARFSRAGVDGLVNLAYGQSTLFVDFLAMRHGMPALARFLTTLGEGTAQPRRSARRSARSGRSGRVRGFAGVVEGGVSAGPVRASSARCATSRPSWCWSAGRPSKRRWWSCWMDGELIRRREIDLDGAGMLVVSLPTSLLDGSGSVRLRVTVPMLGVLEIDPVTGTSARPAIAPVRAPRVAASPCPTRPRPGACPRRPHAPPRAARRGSQSRLTHRCALSADGQSSMSISPSSSMLISISLSSSPPGIGIWQLDREPHGAHLGVDDTASPGIRTVSLRTGRLSAR